MKEFDKQLIDGSPHSLDLILPSWQGLHDIWYKFLPISVRSASTRMNIRNLIESGTFHLIEQAF